jgi:hypothetical protein
MPRCENADHEADGENNWHNESSPEPENDAEEKADKAKGPVF